MRRSTALLLTVLMSAGIAFLPAAFHASEVWADETTPSDAVPADAGIQEKSRSMGIPTTGGTLEVGQEGSATFKIYDKNITDSDIIGIDWWIEDTTIADFKTEPETHNRTVTFVAKGNGETNISARVIYLFLGDERTKTLSSSIHVGVNTNLFQLSLDRTIPVGGKGTCALKIVDEQKVYAITEILWEITDPSIAALDGAPDVENMSVTYTGVKAGESHIYVHVVYNDGKQDTYGSPIYVTSESGSSSETGIPDNGSSSETGIPGSSSSGSSSGSSGGSGGGSGSSGSSGSGGGSGSGGSSSSSKISTTAKAAAPLPAVTPIVTDSNGVCHFGDAVIAQPPQQYSNSDRTLLITSGTWSMSSNGYWMLNDTIVGNLKGRWALVSDSLSQNPAGNASWFYFDNNGYAASGWRWIAGTDGVYRCYYFNQEAGSLFGACLLNGTTPDGFTVDATGAWTVNGVVQTK